MAYPFVQMPTLGEFIQRACREYGCAHEQEMVVLVGPDGETRVSTLSHGEDGEKRTVVLPFRNHDERLAPHTLRSLCRRLGLPLSDFGLVLTDEGLLPSDC